MIQSRSALYIECDLESERNLNWGSIVTIHTLEEGTPPLLLGHWWKIIDNAFVEIPAAAVTSNIFIPNGLSLETTTIELKESTDLVATKVEEAKTATQLVKTTLETTNNALISKLNEIKAKTDNLDVLLSTRTKPADTQIVSAPSASYYHNNNVNETRIVKTGAGKLKRIVFNAPQLGTLTIYNNTAGSGGIIAAITLSAGQPLLLEYDLAFAIGLTYVSVSSIGSFTIIFE